MTLRLLLGLVALPMCAVADTLLQWDAEVTYVDDNFCPDSGNEYCGLDAEYRSEFWQPLPPEVGEVGRIVIRYGEPVFGDGYAYWIRDSENSAPYDASALFPSGSFGIGPQFHVDGTSEAYIDLTTQTYHMFGDDITEITVSPHHWLVLDNRHAVGGYILSAPEPSALLLLFAAAGLARGRRRYHRTRLAVK